MKCVLTLLYKFVLCLYMAVDFTVSLGTAFIIAFAVMNIVWIFYLHMEIGYCKVKIRIICIRLNYSVVVFSFLIALKCFRSGDEMSFMVFLVLYYIMCFLIADLIERKLVFMSTQKKMMFIKDQSELESHILYLIRFIDTF